MRVCEKGHRGVLYLIMTAWAVIRAMERHEPFASYVSKGILSRTGMF